jgi:hypothetical protein
MIARRIFVAGLMAALLLAPALAVADGGDPDAEAWVQLQRGVSLYQQGDYVAARAALAKARELVPGRVPTIDRWLGVTDARLGRCAEAVTELERFLATSPTDPDGVADATAARDGCKQMLATHGTLRVETAPPGAEVRLDADDPGAPPVGTTPLSLESAPLGDHLVSVRREGFQPVSRIVSIAGGQTVKLELALTPLVVTPPPVLVPAPVVARRAASRPFWKRTWFWPVVAGTAVVIIGASVGIGVAASKPSYPTVSFQ